MLSGFQKYYILPEIKVDFSVHEGSSQPNGIFLPTDLTEMLYDYMYLDIIFPFAFGNADTWIGLQDDAVLTHIHIL